MTKPPPQKSSDTPREVPADDDTSKPESAPSGSMCGEPGDAIGRQLKVLFDDVAAEPLPDRLRQLIEQLGGKSGETK